MPIVLKSPVISSIVTGDTYQVKDPDEFIVVQNITSAAQTNVNLMTDPPEGAQFAMQVIAATAPIQVSPASSDAILGQSGPLGVSGTSLLWLVYSKALKTWFFMNLLSP
jgi:hypothetical protein